jgi:type IV fimbrial biogenesis protein FimT
MTMSIAAPRAHAPKGFTLIELMMALAVMVILIAVAAPSLRDTVMNMRMTGQANDLLADLALARGEAIKRNIPVYLCSSSDGATCTASEWDRGWMVFVDTNRDNKWSAGELPLKSRPAFEVGDTLASAGHDEDASVKYVPYKPSGISNGKTIMFVMCDSRTTPLAGRRIEITNVGRPVVTPETCPKAP